MFKKIKTKIQKKISQLSRSNSYMLAAAITNYNTFSEYKDINKGKSVVLCGAGPTFAKYIPLDNAIHVALNRALLNDKIKFDYFIADDWDGINFFQDKLINYDCVKFFGHQIVDFNREIPETFARKCKAKRYYTDSFMVANGYESIPVSDIDRLPVGNMPNIALSALQIILYTNPDKIYLVGCDASSNGHYTEQNVTKEHKAKIEKDLKIAVSGDRVIYKWHEMKNFINAFYPDIEIISINPVGLKGIFTDKYQNGEEN